MPTIHADTTAAEKLLARIIESVSGLRTLLGIVRTH